MLRYKYAFSLSKDEVKRATPPGTVALVDRLRGPEIDYTNHVGEIILVPPPSLDPADPLNFPFWRKAAILFCMSLVPFVVNFTASSISSTIPILASPIGFGPSVPASHLTYLVSVNTFLTGITNIFWVPLADTFGRRPILLLALLILTLSSMWAGYAHSFTNLLAARAIMGLGGGPADTVCPNVVGEIYFVHQRGRAMAIYTVGLAVGSLMGGLVGGYIAAIGLQWIHWVNVILSGVTLFLCFIFVPETLFDRREAYRRSGFEETTPADAVEKAEIAHVEIVAPNTFEPYTFVRSLSIGTYRPGIFRKFVDLFVPLALPGVWLVALWYAGLVGGTVTISTIAPTYLAAPPYLWGANVGLIGVGGIIGTVLGGAYTYLVADWATKRFAKRDTQGYSEPEARLWTALPALFIATIGLWTFGFCAQNPGPKVWLGMEFGNGMEAFGLMQAPSIGFNYMLEAYNAISGDCFVTVVVARSIISFTWTFFVGTWSEKAGPAQPFGIFGMLMGLFSLLTIPMIIWGKRTRIATAKLLPAQSEH